jgi:predicted hydrocarbon binding protein
MTIKDEIVKWYIQNIEMPDREVLDHPGFIGERLGDRQFFLREIAVPEDILVTLENRISDSDKLYQVGKEFGYRYAQSSRFVQYDDVDRKKFLKKIYLLTRYVESISYGQNLNNSIDYENQVFTLNMENYIVCRKNGNGYILSSGGIAGIWSYLIENTQSEGVQISCEGKGDDYCSVICAPRNVLDKKGRNYTEADISPNALNIANDYNRRNQKQETDFAENSLQDLIDVGFFTHENGLIYHDEDRYVLSESSLVYLLEKKLDTEAEQLFNAAYTYGQQLADQESDRDMEKFITEYLSACGWGDTLIKETDDGFEVQAHLFPWTRFYEETTFPIYRGLVSGLLSGFTGRDVALTAMEKDLKGDGFTVIVSED